MHSQPIRLGALRGIPCSLNTGQVFSTFQEDIFSFIGTAWGQHSLRLGQVPTFRKALAIDEAL